MRFGILTDSHCVTPGETLFGIDPLANLKTAVEVLNRNHAGLDFVIHMGDLTHRGELVAFEGVAEALAARGGDATEPGS